MMFGLKTDKEGLLYTDDNTNLGRRLLSIDNRMNKRESYASYFFSIPGTDDYIIKRPITSFNRTTREEYKYMLVNLLKKQSVIFLTDFPIGYSAERRKMEGLIVRFYKPGMFCTSFDRIKETEGFKREPNKVDLIKQYYYHDEDGIRNLFLLLNDLLDVIYEMFENGIYYTDINPGNIVLYKNSVRMIDFDPSRVTFNDEDLKLKTIMKLYIDLLNEVLLDYELYDYVDETVHDFDEAKGFTKRLEDKVRNYR